MKFWSNFYAFGSFFLFMYSSEPNKRVVVDFFLKITNILIIHSLVVKTSFLMIENSMGHGFL